MGNEQSVTKAIASAQKRKDTSVVYRGDLLDLKWIPDEAASLKLECLKLIDMKLYMVPPQIFSILSLKQLDMSQNGLYSIRGIGSLVNITDLDLSGNCLEYLPDELCNLTSLAFINVSKNYLTNRSIPQGLFEKSFNTVDVSENQLAKLSPEFLQCFIKSESVIIHSNPWENAELAKITADSSEEAVKQTLQSLIPAIPAKRASVQSLKDLSPTNNSAGDLIEPIKQTPPTGAKPPVVRPRGEAHKDEASPTKDESHLSPSQNSKPPLVKPKLSESGSAEPPTQEETPASKAPPLKPKPNEKDAEEEGLASPKPPVFKSKSEVVMGSKEKEHEAAKLASSKAEVDPTGAAANVSDLSKKIGMSIPTKPYGRGRSDSIPSSVPGTPHEEHKVDTFPTIESHESKATPPPSSSGIGSMFKNFSSKMRGNTNAPKPAETVIQPPERTAAPLKTMTRAAGPKGRKAATIDQITEGKDVPLSPAKRALTNGSTSSENARGSSSESPAVMVCDVRISVVQETEMTSMLEQCAESPPPTINIASKPRKLSHRAEGIVNSSTGESLEVESVPRKISGGKKNENPIKEESAPEVKARKEPPVPASRTNPTPVPDHGKSAKIDMAELKRKQNVEPIKEEPKPAVPIVPKTESASAKKLAAFAPKEPVVAPKDSAVSAKSDQNATTKSSEPPLAAKPSRTAAAAAAVGDVLSANMVSGPRKPPPGGVAMFDIGAMKKAQIEDPEEEELTSPKVHGHRKEPSGVPGGIRMVMPDLANHKLKSVGMLDGPESDTGKNSLKPDNLAPKPGAKGPPLAAKPSFSQAKSAAGSTVPRADAAKEDEQAEKIPPWKAELEKRKNFQPAT